MNRKRLALAILLGVFAVCLVYAYLAMPRLEKAPPRSSSQRARSVDTGDLKSEKAKSSDRIDFAFLISEPEDFPGAKRDIFRFGQHRPVRTEIPTPVAESLPAEAVVNTAIMPEVVPMQVVQRSLGQFTFLGFLDKGGEKTVFLSSGGNLFLVKQGERFGVDREFHVAEIDNKLLKVSHSGRNGLIEIPLIEQQKLAASASSPAVVPRDPVAPVPMNNTRIFKPQRRMVRPDAPQEREEALPEMTEEFNPEVEQEVEKPVEGEVLEGEVNGAKQ